VTAGVVIPGRDPLSYNDSLEQALRRKVYDSYDYLDGKNASNEKRKPDFKGE